MLTRLVRIQLVIFTIAGIVAMVAMGFHYLQLPTLLGIGRITVTLELPASGGLYRFSNVTYRGFQIGTVTAVDPTIDGARATLSLQESPRIPADLTAQVHSVSAAGEQYVDLLPRTGAPPFLSDGDVIRRHDTTVPQSVGPLLDQVSALLDSIPKGKLRTLIDETAQGVGGSGYDLGSLIDSAATISGDVNGVADRSRLLIENSAPLIDSQAQSADAIRLWSHSVAGLSGQLVTDDSLVRTVLRTGPDAFAEVSRLLNQIKPTLPILLANLTSLGQVALTYHRSLEQLLVLYPPFVAAIQTVGLPSGNPTGIAQGDFSLTLNDPPACTVGFLPPSAWRPPSDTTEVDTPDGLYCKLPQDSPVSVRGARNYPCMDVPGKRAPTVQECESDKPYEPIATRQHALGPYPMDPNLVSQGIPPDSRADPGAGIYGPLAGTPLPPDAAPTAPAAAPSAYRPDGSRVTPSMSTAQYDPRSGAYRLSDGSHFTQTNLAEAPPGSWTDLLPR